MGNDFTTYVSRRSDCGSTTGTVEVRLASHTLPTAKSDPVTDRMQRVWSAGDYDRIAAGFRHEARAFVERLALGPAYEVLDAACGSGNLTIPAAQSGARVTGFDLVPELLDATADWAEREEVAIHLDQGTVEDLPYADATFDVVMSMFGLMFAARPERVTAELARVTRRGGKVVLANWTRAGFVGQLLSIHAAYVTPPAGIPSVLMWGDESVVRERLPEHDWFVTTARRTLTFHYPHSPAETAELFRTCYGPTIRTLEALDKQRARQLAADLTYHWERYQRLGARNTEVDSEYLEVIAIRR